MSQVLSSADSSAAPPPLTIAPSILTADFACLRPQIEQAEEGGADRLHLDVMDGHFVPNITFGPDLIRGLRRITPIPFDVHLMIESPEGFVDAFREAGADRLIVHAESSRHLNRLVAYIRSTGALAGVAINPATPIIDLEELCPYLDMVLVMSVNPGFGGQKFIPSTVRKIYRMRRLLDRWNAGASVGVDGGIDAHIASEVAAAGADNIVAGSSVFNDKATPQENIQRLRASAHDGLERRALGVRVENG